ADPQTGLIQTFPQLIGAETLFARIQQFSNVAYGWLLAEGLAHPVRPAIAGQKRRNRCVPI
ncbi:MAG: hypothetical protein AAFQ18_09330, partial [Pseudomonadota bacterium]